LIRGIPKKALDACEATCTRTTTAATKGLSAVKAVAVDEKIAILALGAGVESITVRTSYSTWLNVPS